MRKYISTLAFFVLLINILFAQFEDKYAEFSDEQASCTSIAVGKKATQDGSVIVCQTCDANYRTWVNIKPHQKFEKPTTRKIYWGLLHTETPWDLADTELKGEIPEVSETYSFVNVAYPCLNEKQLAMGETTIGGKRELRNKKGLFRIENLQAIALERCTTAREAIKLMGDLAVKYGYGDAGECLNVADKNEIWQFEIFGAGSLYVSAVWAAQRIPDDHVGISANRSRIGKIDLNNPDYFMASDNVISLAKEMKFYDPEKDGEFSFWKAYSGRTPFSIRDYFVLSTVAPSLNLKIDAEELPFSVKPEKKLSLQDVFALYRNAYEGTEYDMTKNLLVPKNRRKGYHKKDFDEEVGELVKSRLANPWMNRKLIRLLNTVKPGTVEYQRTIPVARCSYSQVVQLRDWLPDEVGGIAWFAFDNPAHSPRIPIFAGVTKLPESFNFCAQKRFRMDSACWAFKRANRLATVEWGKTKEHINGNIKTIEEMEFADLPNLETTVSKLLKEENGKEKAKKYLTNYTDKMARAAESKWWELGDLFWAFFAREM